ncbi:hypothetical protein R1sor_013650 [Riccia sorocarpa]|uniref:Coiled-coil domain-containing protein 61 n=1 Tax=Riccia sorocarpa TaxID=122646 RepID=A0ABD3HBA9_9MARC
MRTNSSAAADIADASPCSGTGTIALRRLRAFLDEVVLVHVLRVTAVTRDSSLELHFREFDIILDIIEGFPMQEYDVELVFQREDYCVSVRETKGATLTIEVERKDDGCRWRGDFTSRYIEEITHRAGNLKSFKVFVEMLKAAFQRKSTALLVDLLTYQDLEKLVVTRGTDTSHSTPSCRRALASEKRYLILTYIAEFDRVHYPLPLIYEEDADPKALKRCIQRLRSELDRMKAQVRSSETGSRFGDAAAKDLDQNCRDPINTGDCSVDDCNTLRRTIMKLMKENNRLMENVRRAKEAEERMSVKIKDQAFEITLLKRQLSVRGGRDVSPSPFRHLRDVSPARSRQRSPHLSPYRPRLPEGPSFQTRSSSASRKSPSSSISSRSGSRSSSCPGLRPISSSVPSSPRGKPPLDSKKTLTRSRITSTSPMDTRDLMGRKSPRPSSIRMPKPFSTSSSGSSENYQSKLLTHRRAEEKSEKWSGSTPPGMRTLRGTVGVEDIDSRLVALCKFLKSSHGK